MNWKPSFFFQASATNEIYTLSLHDALPISSSGRRNAKRSSLSGSSSDRDTCSAARRSRCPRDRKSTRLNSSHANISYAVFCLKKKNKRWFLNEYDAIKKVIRRRYILRSFRI